jgi:hypothetical protein
MLSILISARTYVRLAKALRAQGFSPDQYSDWVLQTTAITLTILWSNWNWNWNLLANSALP